MGIENREGLGLNEAAWTMAGSSNQATLKNVLDAFRTAPFSNFASGSQLRPYISRLQDGATQAELSDFTDAVYRVPGAVEALESALVRVAPHLAN